MAASAVVFAYHDVGVGCLRKLLVKGINVPLVVTHKDDANENVWFASVAQLCDDHNIPYITPEDPKSAELLDRIECIQPDFIFSFYYRYMLPVKLLQKAKVGAYNMHGSLLPKYRGRAPVNWAVLHGESQTGVTLHEMVAKPDAGLIVAKQAVPILPDETAFEVFQKLTPAAEETLESALPMLLSNSVTLLPNDISNGSYFGRRNPDDGQIDWSETAANVYNLHRAVAPPYPGAWTLVNDRKYIIGKARLASKNKGYHPKGLVVEDGQIFGVCADGSSIIIPELLDETGAIIESESLHSALRAFKNNNCLEISKRIFILGVGGFIGHHLLQHILEKTTWQVVGIDMSSRRIEALLESQQYKPRIDFRLGDVESEMDWIQTQIKSSDIVVPLTAIATPWHYVKMPLRIFEVDFEANLAIIRLTAQYKKRLVFPSTSEVYGMCPDAEFDVDTSNLVCGPINKPRWIYSSSKQLLDRIIYAYGAEGLDFTIFRPFNWFGPGLDSLDNSTPGSSRVTTQFLGHITRGENVTLVNGGEQKRTFLYVDDAMSALLKILANLDGIASGKIYNIGNPDNNISIKDLAEVMLKVGCLLPEFSAASGRVEIISESSASYYGDGYQDVKQRVPNIERTKAELDWQPTTSIDEGVSKLFQHLSSQKSI